MRPDFSQKPKIEKIDNSLGVLEICPYLKSGIESGIAQYRYNGNAFEIYVEMMNIFKKTQFYFLYSGELEKTKKLIIAKLKNY